MLVELPDFLMLNEELFGLPQILGGLNLLDAPRKVRAIEKKIGMESFLEFS